MIKHFDIPDRNAHPNTFRDQKLKFKMISRNILLKFLLLGVLSSLALAVDEKTAAEDDANSLFSSSDDEDLEESGRVAFVTVDTNGNKIYHNLNIFH